MIKARVTVTLKNGVLDPQGKAIEGALGALGFNGVGHVRQGKVFDIEIDSADKAKAEKDKAAQAAQAAESGFNYFVQAGAFRRQNEAEAQRAKLAMLGWEARISEREQNGITVFRVRVGPFTKRDDAEQLKGKLDGAGVESTLVRAAK